jgi:transposase
VLEATGNALAIARSSRRMSARSRVWMGDERMRLLRWLVSGRRQLVKQSTEAKNETSAVLLRTLQGRPPVSDVFANVGRA